MLTDTEKGPGKVPSVGIRGLLEAASGGLSFTTLLAGGSGY
jgi:hypothetical protein